MGVPSTLPRSPQHPVGQRIKGIYTDRLHQFTQKGQYEGQNLVSYVSSHFKYCGWPSLRDRVLTICNNSKFFEATDSDENHVKLSVYSVPDLQRPSFQDAVSHEFKPTHVGASFGPSWSTHWFRIRLIVPDDLRDKEHLEFHWDANNEGLVWTEDGHPLQGLTGGGERVEWIIPNTWRDGNEHTFYIEMACNGMSGNAPGGDSIQPPATDTYYTLQTAKIVAVNLDARALYYDFWIIGGWCTVPLPGN